MLIMQIFYQVKTESIDLFKSALLENANASVQEMGVIRFDVYQDAEDPSRFTLLEIYRDEAAQKTHFETDHFKQWRARLAETDMVLERSVRTWNNLYPERGLLGYPMMPWRIPARGPVTAGSVISLVEVTEDNARDVFNLHTDSFQRRFVSDNARSLAQAGLEPKAWARAIYADQTPVGFVMLLDDREKPLYYLWRYMIDYRYQGLGFGRKALEKVIAHVRTLPGAAEFFLSYVPGPGCPRDFYAKLGFVETGVEDDGELEMKLVL